MNVRPGDLAILTGGFAENVGAIVEVIEPSKDWVHYSDEQIWTVRILGRSLTVVNGARGRKHSHKGTAAARDSHLRPISGLPVEDKTPIETNIPEALQLALGIQARVWA